MTFKVRATQRFSSGREGHVKKGSEFTTDRDRAFELQGMGVAQIIEGDDTSENFETKDGRASSSPQAQAQGRQTSDDSKDGPASSLTTDTVSTAEQTRSTPRTAAGGITTSSLSGKPSKAASGRATKAPQKGTASSPSKSSAPQG